MKKILIIITLFVTILFNTVSADMGPKRSVSVDFSNLNESDTYYATLLSKTESTGPYAKRDTLEEQISGDFIRTKDGWISLEDSGLSIADYQEIYDYNDSYYALDFLNIVSNDIDLIWSYYPPYEYKILLFNANTKEILISESLKSNAFEAYYDVNLDNDLAVRENYNIISNTINFLIRLTATLLIELLIFYFIFKKKEELFYITKVNIFTQVLLNIVLSLAMYLSGLFMFYLVYFILEILIIVIEAILYKRKIKKPFITCYAIIANTLSFIIGVTLGSYLPFLLYLS